MQLRRSRRKSDRARQGTRSVASGCSTLRQGSENGTRSRYGSDLLFSWRRRVMIVGAVDCGDKSKASYFTACSRAASWGRATGDNGTRWGDPSTVGAVRPLFQRKPQACPEVSLALTASVTRCQIDRRSSQSGRFERELRVKSVPP